MWPFSRKKYVLKARCDGDAVELGEFSKKIGLGEALQYIEGMEDRCVSIYLEEHRGGRKVKNSWFKSLRPKIGTTVFSDLERIVKVKKMLDEAFGNKDPGEYFASAVMLIKSLRELANELNASGSKSELSEIIEMMRTFAQLRNVLPQTQQVELPPPPPESRREAERRVEEIVSRSYEETSKAVAPCADGGEKCEEGGGE